MWLDFYNRFQAALSGERTLLDIVERREIELDELLVDADIARTASGSLVEDKSVELKLAAALALAGHLVRAGYLGAA